MAVSVRDLTARYGDLLVFKDVSFDVYRGEVFVILGGSGCGKSTLLKHMIGLYEAHSGEIEIDGRSLTGAGARARKAIMQAAGVMYQSGALFGSMTLRENVALPLEEFSALPPDAVAAVADAKLRLVGLEGFEGYMPSQISGGMRKRAAIARAMALDPDILFLDEPSAGLDPITSAEVDELIKQLAEGLGVTFIVVTHELSSVFAIANRVIMLDKETKGIIAMGDPRELRASSAHPFVRRFLGRAEVAS